MGGARARACAAAALALAVLPSCGSTVDSLGYNGPGALPLGPLTGPPSYPNAFRDLLGKTDAEIAAKIAATFTQLFHGDPFTQAIYFPIGGDKAAIQDILHGDVRTEGIGFGMLIAVELGKQDELDRLWTYAKSMLRIAGGSTSGYFSSFCERGGATVGCLDPFGLQQMAMALIFANDRYTRANAPLTAMPIDYAVEARTLLDLMRHKQDQNGGIVDGVTDTFDPATKLVLDVPDVSAAGVGRPSIEMPAYYDLWAQATGDPFWTGAAAAARAYWQRAAHPTTGLLPVRATFAGAPVAGSDSFQPEGYRAQLNMVLDSIWSGGSSWSVGEGDRLLGFFSGQGIDSYGGSYSLDGATTLSAARESALIAMNGVSALTAAVSDRAAYVDAVWNLEIPIGIPRYYAGLLDLLALLVLGGQMHVL
jgi:oligosaccharide reducing-end xylanase